MSIVATPFYFALTCGRGRRGDNLHFVALDARLDAKGVVLRHVNPDPDHVAVGHRKHRSAARGIGRDQAADVDVPLRNDTVKRSDDLLVDLLLVVILELLLYRRSIVLS